MLLMVALIFCSILASALVNRIEIIYVVLIRNVLVALISIVVSPDCLLRNSAMDDSIGGMIARLTSTRVIPVHTSSQTLHQAVKLHTQRLLTCVLIVLIAINSDDMLKTSDAKGPNTA